MDVACVCCEELLSDIALARFRRTRRTPGPGRKPPVPLCDACESQLDEAYESAGTLVGAVALHRAEMSPVRGLRLRPEPHRSRLHLVPTP